MSGLLEAGLRTRSRSLVLRVRSVTRARAAPRRTLAKTRSAPRRTLAKRAPLRVVRWQNAPLPKVGRSECSENRITRASKIPAPVSRSPRRPRRCGHQTGRRSLERNRQRDTRTTAPPGLPAAARHARRRPARRTAGRAPPVLPDRWHLGLQRPRGRQLFEVMVRRARGQRIDSFELVYARVVRGDSRGRDHHVELNHSTLRVLHLGPCLSQPADDSARARPGLTLHDRLHFERPCRMKRKPHTGSRREALSNIAGVERFGHPPLRKTSRLRRDGEGLCEGKHHPCLG